MQQYFPCHRCGTHNLVGAVSCSFCRQQLYYNCPHCGAWVDNRYHHCPNCSRALNWPKSGGSNYSYGDTLYAPQYSYVVEKKGNPWPAILVSLFIIGMAALIITNPGSSNTTKNDITVATLQTSQPSSSPSASQAVITASSPNGQPSSASLPASPVTQVPATGNTDYLPSGVTLTTSNGEVFEIQMSTGTGNTSSDSTINTTATADSTGYIPKRSAYAQQMFPTWGHCRGGSCQAYYQP